MSVEDYRINAYVRSVLVKRWIDTSRIDFGTTNGIVYLKGILRQVYGKQADQQNEEVDYLLGLVHKLEKELKTIPGVRDVVFRLDGFEKKGAQWKRRVKTLP
ncbi:MAG: hypothetical protein V2A71_09360 [Candidatus Eisenbacteria bacterium]